jgi:tubulin-specific chaperone A
MAPSQIQIATSSLQRLIKEEASYYKEHEQQEARIAKLEKDTSNEDGNREFILKQEVSLFKFTVLSSRLRCSYLKMI